MSASTPKSLYASLRPPCLVLSIKYGQEYLVEGVRVAEAKKPDILVFVVEGYRL